MATLNLTLHGVFFDMVGSDFKKEEYREIKKFWVERLCKAHLGCLGGDLEHIHKNISYTLKEFDKIKFTNGYGAKRPYILIECKGLRIGVGKSEWGATADECFIIELGKIIEYVPRTKNN